MARKKRAKKVHKVKPEPEPKAKLDTKLIIGLGILIILAIAFTRGGPQETVPEPTQIPGKYVLFDKQSIHEQGKAKMMVFFDFYCSHCYTFDTGLLPQLENKYGSSLVVTSRGYPIFGAKAIPPLRAYELAKDLGKGEEMKIAIFRARHVENKDISDTAMLAAIASQVGLDGNAFKKALDGNAKMDKVRANIALGESYNLRQTPTLVFDGYIVVTDITPQNLETIISSLIS